MRISYFSIALAAILAFLYVIAWPDVDKRQSDFAAFYSGGRLYQQHRNPYDLSAQCEIENTVGASLCLPFNHPPILLPLLSSLVVNDYILSYWRWVACLLVVLLLCWVVLFRIFKDWIACSCALVFFCVYQSLFQGQDSVFLLLSVALCLVFLSRDRSLLAGICLSLACIRPHIALALSLPLLFCNRRVFLGFCLASIVLVVFCFVLVGIQGMEGLVALGKLSASGSGYGANQWAMPNLTGFLVRNGISPNWQWLIYPLGIVANSIVLYRYRMNTTTLSLAIVITLLTAPHIHVHDLSLLVIPSFLFSPLLLPILSVAFIVIGASGLQEASFLMLCLITLATLLGARAYGRTKASLA